MWSNNIYTYCTSLRCSTVYTFLHRDCKQLSSSVTIGALRAFYLSVHPDFFAQHPTIQKVNESSLKRLNNYLDAIQCTRQIKNLEPAKVTFYFRENNDNKYESDFKRVNFTLRSRDLLTNIEHILTSCNLSAAHLKDLASLQADLNNKPLAQRYRKSYSGAPEWEIPRYTDEHVSSHAIGIRKWLRKNLTAIMKHQSESQSVIESNKSFKSTICLDYGIGEIVWCSPWQHSSEQGTLRNFVRFCNQHKDKLQCLHGRIVVFTDQTMAAADGSICLNVEDVPQQWLQFLTKFEGVYSSLYREAARYDNEISKTLVNVKVDRPKVRMLRFREHNLIPINEYVSIVSVFSSALQSFVAESSLDLGAFKDLEISFARSQNAGNEKITVLPNGRLRVDCDCKPLVLLDYVLQNRLSLQNKKNMNASAKVRSELLMKLCEEKLRLLNIMKDFDVTNEQLTTCCERLLQNAAEFMLLDGLEMRVTSNYYSVFDHGQFCIPWNWNT